MLLLLNSQSEGSIHVAAVVNGDWIMLSGFFTESERGLYPDWIMLFSS